MLPKLVLVSDIGVSPELMLEDGPKIGLNLILFTEQNTKQNCILLWCRVINSSLR